MGYALRLCALSLGWLGPGSPWAPHYLFLLKMSGIEQWVITKGLLRPFPQGARAEQTVTPGLAPLSSTLTGKLLGYVDQVFGRRG